MISIYFEVKSGTGCFDSMVCADSIEQAVSIAETRYPGGDARIVYPIDPKAFFVRDHEVTAGVNDIEMAERMTRDDKMIRRTLIKTSGLSRSC